MKVRVETPPPIPPTLVHVGDIDVDAMMELGHYKQITGSNGNKWGTYVVTVPNGLLVYVPNVTVREF